MGIWEARKRDQRRGVAEFHPAPSLPPRNHSIGLQPPAVPGSQETALWWPPTCVRGLGDVDPLIETVGARYREGKRTGKGRKDEESKCACGADREWESGWRWRRFGCNLVTSSSGSNSSRRSSNNNIGLGIASSNSGGGDGGGGGSSSSSSISRSNSSSISRRCRRRSSSSSSSSSSMSEHPCCHACITHGIATHLHHYIPMIYPQSHPNHHRHPHSHLSHRHTTHRKTH